jgi:hypothetical protein
LNQITCPGGGRAGADTAFLQTIVGDNGVVEFELRARNGNAGQTAGTLIPRNGGILNRERALPSEDCAAGVGTVVSRTRITIVSALPAQGKIIEEGAVGDEDRTAIVEDSPAQSAAATAVQCIGIATVSSTVTRMAATEGAILPCTAAAAKSTVAAASPAEEASPTSAATTTKSSIATIAAVDCAATTAAAVVPFPAVTAGHEEDTTRTATTTARTWCVLGIAAIAACPTAIESAETYAVTVFDSSTAASTL